MPTNATQADTLRAIAALPERGGILLLGAVDTGKTTLAHEAVRHAVRTTGATCALVDADVGQSEIGIPGVVACAIASPANVDAHARDWPRRHAAFVGCTSPSPRLAKWLGAVAACVRACRSAGAGRIVVDTPGWVTGPVAREAYAALLQISPADLVVLLERPRAPNPLAALFSLREPPPVVARIETPEGVGRKARATRTARRSSRLGAYFRDASRLEVAWERVGILGGLFAGEQSMPPHVLKFIGGVLSSRCLYATRSEERQLHVIVDKVGPASADRQIAPITEQFGVRGVVVTPSSSYHSLLVGLADSAGQYLESGLIESIDFASGRLYVLTPLKNAAPIAQIELGLLRCRRDGKELGELRVGTF